MDKIEKYNYLSKQIDVRKKALSDVDEKLAAAAELEAEAKALREEAEKTDVEGIRKEISMLEELKKDYEETSADEADADEDAIPEDPDNALVGNGGVN